MARKARESYGNNNLVGHPSSQVQLSEGRNLRKTGAYGLQAERGAHFVQAGGAWENPAWFRAREGESASAEEAAAETAVDENDSSGISGYLPSFRHTNWHAAVQREVEAVNTGAGIIDVSSFAKFHVSGPGAAKFLDRLVANRLPKEGRLNISHMLTPSGKVLAELTVTRLRGGEGFYIVTGGGSELHDLRWMQHVANTEFGGAEAAGVRIDNVSGDYAVLSVAGPLAREVLEEAGASCPLSDEEFPFLTYKDAFVGKAPVRAVRVTFTGELGWELHVPLAYSGALYASLAEAGAAVEARSEASGAKVRDVGSYAVNAMRIEKGFRVWGYDMNKDTDPLEAGLGWAVRLKKKTEFEGRL